MSQTQTAQDSGMESFAAMFEESLTALRHALR